jgi:UDP-glucose 4-epimerase
MHNVLSTEKPNGIIHYAAFSLVGESMKNPYKYYNNNVSGTNTLVKVMADCGIKHIVFSSTAAVYGDAEIMPITESTATNPTNAYGETKLTMEKMISWHGKASGITYISLRYFNVAGAYPTGEIYEKHDPETHLIPIVLQVAEGTRKQVNVFGNDYPTKDGTCIRDYIHVMDLAQAHILAIEYLIKGGESTVCNLGNGEGFSVLEILKAAREVTGHEIPAVISPRRAGDPATLIASSQKAKELLGWEPKHTNIKDIIKSAYILK